MFSLGSDDGPDPGEGGGCNGSLSPVLKKSFRLSEFFTFPRKSLESFACRRSLFLNTLPRSFFPLDSIITSILCPSQWAGRLSSSRTCRLDGYRAAAWSCRGIWEGGTRLETDR